MSIRPLLSIETLAATLSTLALLGCLAGFYLIVLTTEFGRDLLYASGGLLLLSGMLAFPYWKSRRQNIMLVFSLLGMACAYLIWCNLFRQAGEFKGIYSAYERLGKTLVMTALLVLIVSNYRVWLPAPLLKAIAIIAALGINLYAIYLSFGTTIDRVALTIPHATTAAFILTVFNILMLECILSLKLRQRHLILVIAFFISYCAILTTGTRVAMAVYPIVFAGLLLTDRGTHGKLLLASGALAVTAFLAAMMLFKPVIDARIDSFKDDIQLLNKKNSNTSTGARLAMFKAGWTAGLTHPLGQSAESRGAILRDMIKKDRMLKGAEPYITNHMHNEFIETFSERGIVGVILLAWLYVSLLKTALFGSQQNRPLLFITLSMILYGIGDVILFNREGYLVYLIGILLALVFASNGTFERNDTPPQPVN